MNVIVRPDRDLVVVHRDECFEVCARNALLDNALKVHAAFTGFDGGPDWDVIKELDRNAKRIYGLSSRMGYIDFRDHPPEPGSMMEESIDVIRRLFTEGRV